MPQNNRRTFARLLAPLALVVCALALFAVLAGSGVDEKEDAKPPAASEEAAGTEAAPAKPKPRRRATYEVEVGDNLGAIAEKTGVDVETIEELNPELDPQALSPGQKIKLRE